jgi:predicted lipoprotein with Yx(FWY)xxD motif
MSRIRRVLLPLLLCSLIVAVPSLWASWVENGVPLCTVTWNQYYPQITTDGAGGAIVTWYDGRSGSSNDIYAQRINASGTAEWTADGVPLCTATGNQHSPQVTSDGAGGAIVTWYDYRSGSSNDIYAQRINASGTTAWTADGVPLCTATGDQYYPQITSDGAGGAIVTWYDYRSGSSYDIYAQRINASGTAEWTADGVPLCTATGNQRYPQVTSDGAGGAIVTWYDDRSGSSNDIYARRINASGTAEWTADGVPLCTATGDQEYPQVISDGAGGAIIAWMDFRSGASYDIYARRINASGTIQWTTDGVPLCTATGNQKYPQVTSDGAGGAIVTWYDYRSGSNYDIYAQQINSQGKVGYLPPIIHSVSDVPGDEGGCVNLTWDSSPFDYLSGEITEYTVWRALETPVALGMLSSGASIVSSPAAALAAAPVDRGGPILRLASLNGEMFYWKLISSLTAYRIRGYSEVVPTLFDSTAVCDDCHYFQVIAHTVDPSVFWISDPDSGYSVDNLAPCPPAMLAGEQLYSPAGVQLTWEPNTEQDMDCYNVYRDLSEYFVPGPGNLLESVCDTTSFDGGWTWDTGYYYKVSAVDIHGNESGFALLAPENVTGTDTPETPMAAYLRQNFPNPFNPATTIEFGLERHSHVSLRVYDAAGRLTRVIANNDRPAGHYSEVWDGKDGCGRAVSSGVYFYRLDTGSLTRTRKMILLK